VMLGAIIQAPIVKAVDERASRAAV
jgi:hypothetical protein